MAHVRPRDSPVTAPLNGRDWTTYLVEQRAAKRQKTLLSPATEPAQPSCGRFKVWHAAADNFGEKTNVVEKAILPLLSKEFCLAQRQAANAVLKEEGICCRFPTSKQGQRLSMTARDIHLLMGGDEPSPLRPVALERVKAAFAYR